MKDAEIPGSLRRHQQHSTLQWGRVVKDAEIAIIDAYRDEVGSLQWGRVVKDAEIMSKFEERAGIKSFNGAAS